MKESLFEWIEAVSNALQAREALAKFSLGNHLPLLRLWKKPFLALAMTILGWMIFNPGLPAAPAPNDQHRQEAMENTPCECHVSSRAERSKTMIFVFLPSTKEVVVIPVRVSAY